MISPLLFRLPPGTRLFVASEMRLGIGHVFVESISNAGMYKSFGTVRSAEEKKSRNAVGPA